MALLAQKPDGGDHSVNAPLLKVLTEGWMRNDSNRNIHKEK